MVQKRYAIIEMISISIQTKIEVIKQSKDTAAESILRTHFKMEMVVYTQDSTYSHSLKKMKGDNGVVVNSSSLYTNSTISERTTLQEMAMHIKSYYQVSPFPVSIVLIL